MAISYEFTSEELHDAAWWWILGFLINYRYWTSLIHFGSIIRRRKLTIWQLQYYHMVQNFFHHHIHDAIASSQTNYTIMCTKIIMLYLQFGLRWSHRIVLYIGNVWIDMLCVGNRFRQVCCVVCWFGLLFIICDWKYYKYDDTINNTCRFTIIWFTAINCDGIQMKQDKYDANKEHYIGYNKILYVWIYIAQIYKL